MHTAALLERGLPVGTRALDQRPAGRVLGLPPAQPPIRAAQVADAGLLLTFREYDVEYVVRDIESLVFWLNALDLLHADLDGAAALATAEALNAVLAGNVDEREFVTNEHRYLVAAQLPAQRLRAADYLRAEGLADTA